MKIATINNLICRYKELGDYMKAIAKLPNELDIHERDLLATAFKNLVSNPRRAIRKLDKVIQANPICSVFDDLRSYRESLQLEISETCRVLISLLDDDIIPKITDHEGLIFCYKTKADYLRYILEHQTSGQDFIDMAREAHKSYSTAYSQARRHHHPVDAVVLGIALNYGVFFFEILHDVNSACILSSDAFNDAFSELHTLSGKSYHSSEAIMQNLRENFQWWSETAEVDWADKGRIYYSLVDDLHAHHKHRPRIRSTRGASSSSSSAMSRSHSPMAPLVECADGRESSSSESNTENISTQNSKSQAFSFVEIAPIANKGPI